MSGADVDDVNSTHAQIVSALRKGDLVDLSQPTSHVQAPALRELCLTREPDAYPCGIRLRGATIEGKLDLESVSVPFPLVLIDCDLQLSEFNANGAKFKRLDLTACKVATAIRAVDAVIDDELLVDGAAIAAQLDLTHAIINGRLSGRGLVAQGPIQMGGARIAGEVSFTNARLCAGLDARGAELGGRLFLNSDFGANANGAGAAVRGAVRLDGAHVGAELNLTGAKFTHPDGDLSLSGRNLSVNGNVFINEGFLAEGSVELSGLVAAGQMNAGGAILNGRRSLVLDNARIASNVYLNDGLHAKGTTRLWSADVSGNVDAREAVFEDEFLGSDMSITGILDLRKTAFYKSAALARASVARLDDRETTWPGSVDLDGFSYQSLPSEGDWRTRLRWIESQGQYRAQPYRQLAAVYRDAGRDADARHVAMASEAQRSQTEAWLIKLWRGFLGCTVGYGYEPARAVVVALLLVVVASLVYWRAIATDQLVPSSDSVRATVRSSICDAKYQCANPVAYSFDVVVPLVNLHQRDKWEPDASTATGLLLNVFTWALTGLGWLLATLVVAAVGGFIRHE